MRRLARDPFPEPLAGCFRLHENEDMKAINWIVVCTATMLAATGLDLVKSSANFPSHEWLLLSTGFVISFLVALVAIRWLLNYVRGHSFVAFGWYRIILSVAFVAFLLY